MIPSVAIYSRYLYDGGHDERHDGGRDAKVVLRRRGGLRPCLGLVPTIIHLQSMYNPFSRYLYLYDVGRDELQL